MGGRVAPRPPYNVSTGCSFQFVKINFINYESSVIGILFYAIVRISINIVDVIDI